MTCITIRNRNIISKRIPQAFEYFSKGNLLFCPMPGLIVEVLAQKGDRVFRGQNLVILESMKMESGVASPVDGVVAEVRAAPGQAVEVEEILIRFEV